MNNQQIAILQSVEAVLKSGVAAPTMRAQLDAIFAHVSKPDREILLNLELAYDSVIRPMWLAVQAGMHEVLGWLIHHGASPDGPAPLGQPLLLSAIDHRHFDSAETLLALGANPHTLNKNGTNSLMFALSQGHRVLAEKLLSAGVALNHVNLNGLNALHFAAMSGDVALFEWVHAQANFALDAPTNDGRHPLHFSGSFALFEWLRSKDPNAQLGLVFANGDQAIHYFCLHGQVEIVRCLLDSGIDLQALGRMKNSPLHYAVNSGNEALVALLIARGAKVEARNKSGMRPMHWAAELGYLSIVETLLAHKAKVKIKGNTSWIVLETHSPLYLAVQNGHIEVVRRLLLAGADVNALNDALCRTALCAACVRDNVEMVDLLLAHGASADGVDSNKDRFMAFPLASARSAEVVRRLIDAGADVNAAGRYKDTALHALVKNIPELALSTAVAEMPRVEKYNPHCIRSQFQKQLAACAALLEHRASPFARDYGFKQPHEQTSIAAVVALLQAARARVIQAFVARTQLPILLAPLANNVQAAIATDPLKNSPTTRVHIVSAELSYSDVLLLQQSIEARFGPVVELLLVDRARLPVVSKSAWNVFAANGNP